jgi:hypothetical protein
VKNLLSLLHNLTGYSVPHSSTGCFLLNSLTECFKLDRSIEYSKLDRWDTNSGGRCRKTKQSYSAGKTV